MKNDPAELALLVQRGELPVRRIWLILALRSATSFALLLAVAGALQLCGHRSATEVFATSAAWWLWFVTATNVVCLVAMRRLARAEGLRLRDFYFLGARPGKSDLMWALLAFAVSAIVAQPPGTLLAAALWADSMLFQPLPKLAVIPLFVLMPTTHALTELPTYWGYVAPRLRALGLSRPLVIALVGGVLSLQHMFFAFQLDWRYDLWLALKFLPFALWTGVVVDRRPTVLPWLMGAHLLLDSALPLLTWLGPPGR
jgi:hypothetical protein